jgi:hypothetical protein
MKKNILAVTFMDGDGEEYKGLFLSQEEISNFLRCATLDGDTMKIIDTEMLSLEDIINGDCDKSFERDYRIEIVAQIVLRENVFRACRHTRNLEGVLEFLDINVR